MKISEYKINNHNKYNPDDNFCQTLRAFHPWIFVVCHGGIVYGIMLIGTQKPPAVKWEGEIYVVRYFFFASSAFTSTLLLVEERLLNSSMTLLNFFGSGLPEVYSRT